MNLTAACGHVVEFQDDPGVRYREEKIAKVTRRPCGPCRHAAHQQQTREALTVKAQKGGKVKKGQEPNALPAGAVILMQLGEDGQWNCHLTALGVEVQATGAGLMGMASKLARRWLQAQGAKLQGKVS